MSIINFLQTREGQNMVAITTTLLIGFAFILGLHPFKSKNKQRTTPSAQWDIESYYMYVKALIASSLTLEQLFDNQPSMKGFFSKPFSGNNTHKERIKYYNRILEVYCQKERELHSAELKKKIFISPQP